MLSERILSHEEAHQSQFGFLEVFYDWQRRHSFLDYHFDIAFTSLLKRAHQTLREILAAKGQEGLQTLADHALNERDYGDLTGKNKWEVQKIYGVDTILKNKINTLKEKASGFPTADCVKCALMLAYAIALAFPKWQ